VVVNYLQQLATFRPSIFQSSPRARTEIRPVIYASSACFFSPVTTASAIYPSLTSHGDYDYSVSIPQ
jgi:hypothetical protein